MINVLIVHDRNEVCDKIRGAIQETGNFVSGIEEAYDIFSAREILRNKLFDIMIMDLTVPNKKNKDEPSFSKVQSFLEEVFDYGDLNVPGDLIGISRETAALQLVKTGLGPHFMVTISEDEEGTWLNYLRDRIKYTIKSAKSRQTALSKHYDKDVLIVTAMDEEFSPYRDLFELTEFTTFPGVYDFVFNDKMGITRYGVLFAIGNSGQASAASRTQSLISWFRPRFAFMSGYCGGLKDKVSLGDLCFFESAASWDYGKWSETRDSNNKLISEQFLPRPNPLSIDDKQLKIICRDLTEQNGCFSSDELKRINDLSPDGILKFSSKFTHAASGSAVVANDAIVAQISGLNDSIRAVDMECYGFYDACINTFVAKPSFLCLKAVSDYCNGEKGDDFHTVCSYMSAITVRKIICEKLSFAEKETSI